MSKNGRKHPLMMRRLVGYTTPLLVFIVLTLWFRPQNEIGWVAVMFGTMLSFMAPVATWAQARHEADTKKNRVVYAESISIMEPPTHETRFYGPYGGIRSHEQPMNYWLSLQPPTTTP